MRPTQRMRAWNRALANGKGARGDNGHGIAITVEGKPKLSRSIRS